MQVGQAARPLPARRGTDCGASLQALPKLQKQRHKRAASSVNSTDSAPFTFSEMSTEISQAKAEAELDDELALALQPLLEQEAMLE